MKKKAVIISYKAKEELLDLIEGLGFEIIKTLKMARLDSRIADHADLQIIAIDDDTFIVEPSTYGYYKNKLSPYGKRVVRGQKQVSNPYPMDCFYNITVASGYFIYNDKSIDPVLETYLKNKHPIRVNQAYTKCMNIVLKNRIITCDRGIFKKLLEYDYKVDLIEFKNIKLDGFNSGFLGGSCGIIGNKQILFTGDISQEKDYYKLLRILTEEGLDPIYPNCDLVDIGSIIKVEV